jgi:hypothetical protein
MTCTPPTMPANRRTNDAVCSQYLETFAYDESSEVSMSANAIRFGVRALSGQRAATWKCWAEEERSEIYLACRELHGELKASFHESGKWHVGYTRKFLEDRFDNETRPATRFIEEWTTPGEIQAGYTLAFQICVPWSATTASVTPGHEDIVWVAAAPEGKAVEISIFISSPECQV